MVSLRVPLLLPLLPLLALLSPSASASSQSAAADQSDDLAAQQRRVLQLCAHFPDMAVCQQVLSSAMEKRKSAYMRFGKRSSEPSLMMKRKSAYMRFGKRSPPEDDEAEAYDEGDEGFVEEAQPMMEKRKSAYMRFGKRKSAYMRFGRK